MFDIFIIIIFSLPLYHQTKLLLNSTFLSRENRYNYCYNTIFM
ncbi:hypothetical protein HMPREF9223_0091 [Lactobacillus iners ATCC 55195]|nr:hypothetical protein HMPREF9223_0091 [Lactobacillus iners ATCC 55195]